MTRDGDVYGFTGRRIDQEPSVTEHRSGERAGEIKSSKTNSSGTNSSNTNSTNTHSANTNSTKTDPTETHTNSNDNDDKFTPESPSDLLNYLLASENQENNNLINIMGNVKPKSVANSLAAIVRGLFTKNSKLLTLLNQAVAETSGSDDKEIFKAFVNDFILWLDDDAVKLFNKYCQQLCSLDEDLIAYSFEKPLFNLSNYIKFIDASSKFLRNPFVMDKLSSMKNTVSSILSEYATFSRTKTLNNINFSNVKVFGSKLKSDKVSGFFRIDQIMDRTEYEPLFIDKIMVELVLLNLAGDGYNSLAVLQVENDARSLIYPPFRINELSIDFQQNKIILKSINFSDENQETSTISVLGENYHFLAQWYNKLAVIFPKEQSTTKEYLIKSTSLAEISGLGINVVSNSQHKQDLGGSDESDLISKPSTFKELISSPSLNSNSPLSQLQNQFQSKEDRTDRVVHEQRDQQPVINSNQPDNSTPSCQQDTFTDLQPNNNSNSDFNFSQPHSSESLIFPPSVVKNSTKASSTESLNFSQPPAIALRKFSNSSVSSDSDESLKSQYDRSLDIINKALSNNSSKQVEHETDCYIKQINRGTLAPVNHSLGSTNSRPLSSEAQFVEQTPRSTVNLDNDKLEMDSYESNMPYSNSFSQSVPNLSSKKSLYQLTTGSALDINNFGKDYNPSFSIVKGINEIMDPVEPLAKEKKSKRKSIFNIFKKTKPQKDTSPYLPQSPIEDEKPEKAENQQVSDKSHESELRLRKSSDTLNKKGSTSNLSNSKNSNNSLNTKRSNGNLNNKTSNNNLNNKRSNGNLNSRSSVLEQPRSLLRKQSVSMDDLAKQKKSLSLEPINTDEHTNLVEHSGQNQSVQSLNSEILQSVTPSDSPLNSPFKNKKGLTINSSLTSSLENLQSANSEKSFSKTKSSTIPSPFALPSSTSTYFFKPYKNLSTTSVAEPLSPVPIHEAITIPQDLKNIINNDQSIDFFITESVPKAIKISKWKQNYGKWEMITVNDKLFIKIVVNYELNKSWMIVFKEEVCDDEEIDVPILLLNIDEAHSSVRRSSALDLQISAVNSITSKPMVVMVRCSTGSLAHSLMTNIENVLGIFISQNKTTLYASLKNSRYESSNATISSSIMDKDKEPHSSVTSFSLEISKEAKKAEIRNRDTHKASNSNLLTTSINSNDINNAQVLNNPANTKVKVLDLMTIRLQQQLQGYDKVNVLSSWKILSMYTLLIIIISDSFSNKNFYHFILSYCDNGTGVDYSWLIPEDDKFNRIEKIGKAGILVKVDQNNIYMVECKGKKEFKKLFELF